MKSVLTFSRALELLKHGKFVCRDGWNGKGMYLFLIGTDMSAAGIGGWTFTNGKNDNIALLPFIAMKTADNKAVPWLASQTDILAEDWHVVHSVNQSLSEEAQQANEAAIEAQEEEGVKAL
jgi:hypothetical protein